MVKHEPLLGAHFENSFLQVSVLGKYADSFKQNNLVEYRGSQGPRPPSSTLQHEDITPASPGTRRP